MGSSLRDSQRSRVYAWERQASADHRFIRPDGAGKNSIYEAEFQTLEECEAFLATLWTSERGRYGQARVAAPAIVRPHRGQRRALAHHDHRISLPRWARSRWVILHEAAHRLNIGREAHGPRFVGILIGLLARHAGYDAEQLLESAAAVGVKVDSRSVGSVPVQSLSARLVRLMPVSEMDAAVELGVSWRQIRGAALSLQQKGQARWLRGRLVQAA